MLPISEISEELPDCMANHVSALKRARQTERQTAVNRANKSRLRTALRAFRESLAKADKKAAEAHFRTTTSLIDKAIQKGSIHANTAARYKSRLSTRLMNVLAK
jgi:small subunit ribosomal protein S20